MIRPILNSILFEAEPGTTINEAISEAHELALKWNIEILLQFNSKSISIHSYTDTNKAIEWYYNPKSNKK